MSSNFVFLGLVHIKIGQQGQNQKINIVKMTEFPDNALDSYLELPNLYNEKRQEQNKWPFITKFSKKPEYLIVLRREANQVFLDQMKFEEFIIQSIPSNCSEQEWRNKATQILLTWNLAECRLKVSDQNDKTSNTYAQVALLYLILAIISFIGINILKQFI